MKRLISYGIILLITFLLTACTHQNAYRDQTNFDLLKENWMQQINLDPHVWTRNASKWYFTGEPQQVSLYAVHAPLTSSMSSMEVRVNNFTNINISGDFTVQIVGQQERNSVEILGPNALVRQVVVNTWDKTLSLSRIKGPKDQVKGDMREVIIRIGVRNLRTLVDSGNGSLTGRGITSDCLSIVSRCGANILLDGNMNVQRVIQSGWGTTTIIGAVTPCVSLAAGYAGTINISGRVGVQSITNVGNGRINVLGADTDGLVIRANSNSVTRVAGIVNLKSVTAYGKSRVFLYSVNSQNLRVIATDKACVGLAGCTGNLSVGLKGSAHFAGEYLKSHTAYVTTHDTSHANITADKHVFASAFENSSIYYIGPPSNIARFISGNGTIIPVWTSSIPSPPVPYHQPVTWSFRKG